MRERQQPGKSLLEIGAALGAIVVFIACAYADAPRLSLATPAARAAREREQTRQSLAVLQTTTQQLQTQTNALQAELVKATRLLESARSGLASLTESHTSLGSQVATTAARLQQFETTVQQTNQRLTQFSESAALQRITRERDDALTQFERGNDQVRQLTLQLQKAGIYP